MTHLDDLDPGDFIAVICDTAWRDNYNDGYTSLFPKEAPKYNGVPLEICAISLPFICVTDGNRRFAIDTRRYQVTKVSDKYQREMQSATVIGRRQSKRLSKAERLRREEDLRGCCPRCHARMNQSLIRGQWVWFCKECQFVDGPAEGLF